MSKLMPSSLTQAQQASVALVALVAPVNPLAPVAPRPQGSPGMASQPVLEPVVASVETPSWKREPEREPGGEPGSAALVESTARGQESVRSTLATARGYPVVVEVSRPALVASARSIPHRPPLDTEPGRPLRSRVVEFGLPVGLGNLLTVCLDTARTTEAARRDTAPLESGYRVGPAPASQAPAVWLFPPGSSLSPNRLR